MRQWLQVIVLALIVTIALNVPAFGGSSIARLSLSSLNHRVSTLERRVNALARLRALQTVRVESTPFPDNGGAAGTTFCPAGTKVVGGGGGWEDQGLTTDHLIASRPDGNGWFAEAGPRPQGSFFDVYALCVDF